MKNQQFAERLRALMDERQMGVSALARALYGERTDAEGKKVVKNRQRIHEYRQGTTMPKIATIAKIAEVLGVDREDLWNPEAVSEAAPEPVQVSPWGFSLVEIPGTGLAKVRLSGEVPLELAGEILGLIAEADRRERAKGA